MRLDTFLFTTNESGIQLNVAQKVTIKKFKSELFWQICHHPNFPNHMCYGEIDAKHLAYSELIVLVLYKAVLTCTL